MKKYKDIIVKLSVIIALIAFELSAMVFGTRLYTITGGVAFIAMILSGTWLGLFAWANI